MEQLIQGVHHIAIKCNGYEQLQKALHFYCDLLGMKPIRSWGQGGDNTIVMVDTGCGILELFGNSGSDLPLGMIPHIAFKTKDVDRCIQLVREAGFEIIKDPTDMEIASQPPLPVRLAFCRGAAGEEVEFFCEK